MSVALESNAFFWGIEYLATFCCGMCGGLAAVRKGYDIFAILVTTWLTALGGGIIRDVLLGIAPPVGVSDKGLVIVALLASVAVAVCHPEINRLKWSMLSLDALALGLYAVNQQSHDVPHVRHDRGFSRHVHRAWRWPDSRHAHQRSADGDS